MKKNVVTISLLLAFLFIFSGVAPAAADVLYQLTEVSASWDGTDASRLKAPIPAPQGSLHQFDYDYTYGDEASVTYTLPWSFSFYGLPYSQINADTNGNIWFSATGSAHAFNLASTGRGPVIAAWHDDLSSYYNGGVFIQHKTDPERIVIEWQTETYTEEGFFRPNDFEVVLFPNGSIRYDYKSFSSLNATDLGSGISSNSGSVINITANPVYGNVYGLAGRSLQFDIQEQVAVAFAGNGSGSVSSNPAGLNCSADCIATFNQGTSLILTATANSGSIFTGWSGGLCAGTGPCSLTLENEMATTATFALLPTASFSVTLPSGAPVTAAFINGSTDATSWSWNFGDGTTSALQNPTHIYKAPGPYTVGLTATNAVGSTTTSQSITVTTCATQPVKNGATYYATLQSAYNAAASGALIQVLATGLTESLLANRDVSVTIDGGYLCGFPANPPDETTLTGAPRISAGSVKLKNVRIKQ